MHAPLTLAGCMGDGSGLIIGFLMVAAGGLLGPVLLAAGVAWFLLRREAKRRARPVAPGWPDAAVFEGADRDLEVARALYERLLQACATCDWPVAPAALLERADALVCSAREPVLRAAARLDRRSAEMVRASVAAVADSRRRLERMVRRRAPRWNGLALGTGLDGLRRVPAPWVGRSWRFLFAGSVFLLSTRSAGELESGRLALVFRSHAGALVLGFPFLLTAGAIVGMGFSPRVPVRDLVTGFALLVTGGAIILEGQALWLPSLVPMLATVVAWARATHLRETRAQTQAA